MRTVASTLALAIALAGCAARTETTAAASATAPAAKAAPTAADADAFIARAEKEGAEFGEYGARVAWVNSTYITDDTDWLASKVGAESTELAVRYAKEAAQFDKVEGLSFDTRRK